MGKLWQVVPFLGAVVLAGAVGFYVGVRRGAESISEVSSQTVVSQSLSNMRISLAALERRDYDFSEAQHLALLRSELLVIGSQSTSIAYWRCSDLDRSTIARAVKIVGQNWLESNSPQGVFIRKGAMFCTQ